MKHFETHGGLRGDSAQDLFLRPCGGRLGWDFGRRSRAMGISNLVAGCACGEVGLVSSVPNIYCIKTETLKMSFNYSDSCVASCFKVNLMQLWPQAELADKGQKVTIMLTSAKDEEASASLTLAITGFYAPWAAWDFSAGT
jgi:hypothetical protein